MQIHTIFQQQQQQQVLVQLDIACYVRYAIALLYKATTWKELQVTESTLLAAVPDRIQNGKQTPFSF